MRSVRTSRSSYLVHLKLKTHISIPMYTLFITTLTNSTSKASPNIHHGTAIRGSCYITPRSPRIFPRFLRDIQMIVLPVTPCLSICHFQRACMYIMHVSVLSLVQQNSWNIVCATDTYNCFVRGEIWGKCLECDCKMR